jgi:peptidoglycan-associated lipoprotein
MLYAGGVNKIPLVIRGSGFIVIYTEVFVIILKGFTIMNIFVKYGSVLSCVFLLAACETPGEGTDVGDTGAANGAGQSGVYPGSEASFVENAGDRVFFETNSSVVTSEGRATIERQAKWLAENSMVNVVIEGHADERGTREYNLALGERRANAAKDVLIASGVNASRITTITYGKERPAVLGSNEQAWSQNRRAVTVLAK